jgi:tryptophan-rich sensory protein
MRFVKLFTLFLIINFGGLALGSWLMNQGPTSDWYLSLNQAPWTPPGWVFGIAWTLIMVCFSAYLAFAFRVVNTARLWLLFGLSLFLNIIWNYIFFSMHYVGLGLIILLFLTAITIIFFVAINHPNLRYIKYLLLPYLIWLLIANSLNAYILIFN